MMEKDLIKNLNNKKKYLFLPMDSNCLQYFDTSIINIPYKQDSDKTVNCFFVYMSILGMNLFKLTSFEDSGFFNERIDASFAFGMHSLLQQDYFTYDSDALKKIEMSHLEFLMKKIIRRKGKFEYGDELLLEKLDLNKAAGILYFTREAKANIKKSFIDKKIIKFDLIKKRNESFAEFKSFDDKILSGELQEFEWD